MLKQSFGRMKKILAIFLAVIFVVSVTSTAVSAGPVMVKEKKIAIIILKDVKTTICKWPHHHHHYSKDMNMKKMDMKNMDVKGMDSKTGGGY